MSKSQTSLGEFEYKQPKTESKWNIDDVQLITDGNEFHVRERGSSEMVCGHTLGEGLVLTMDMDELLSLSSLCVECLEDTEVQKLLVMEDFLNSDNSIECRIDEVLPAGADRIDHIEQFLTEYEEKEGSVEEVTDQEQRMASERERAIEEKERLLAHAKGEKP